MTDVHALLSHLAQLEDGAPVCTLALDTHWRDEQQRERVRVFVRDRIREGRKTFAGDEGLARTFDRIEAWLEEVVNLERDGEVDGFIVYASEDRDLFIQCRLPAPAEPGMWIDTRPRLWPLASQLEYARPIIVADVSSTGALIEEWRFGEVEHHEIERVVPGRHKMGGWSQANFQRQRREHVVRVWKECAQLLHSLVQAQPEAYLILLGQDSNLRAFQKQLPTQVARRVVACRPSPPDRKSRIAIALEVLEEERVAHDFAVVHHVLRQGLSDRSGTVGLEDTLMALNEHRVKAVTLSKRFDARGVSCRSCDGLWTSGATGCVFCGQEVELVSLREEIVRRTTQQGAEINLIDEGGPLDAYRGIGSILRHLSGEERQRLGSTSAEKAGVPGV